MHFCVDACRREVRTVYPILLSLVNGSTSTILCTWLVHVYFFFYVAEMCLLRMSLQYSCGLHGLRTVCIDRIGD